MHDKPNPETWAGRPGSGVGPGREASREWRWWRSFLSTGAGAVMGQAAGDLAVDGRCDARFRHVGEAFAENFAQHGEVGAAVAVTIDGKPVVDLWAGHTDAARMRPRRRDTIVNIASATKGLTATCARLLADRGLLDFDAPVASYWPEFAQAGKAAIPVHMLLSHRAGLPAIDAPLPTEALYDWGTMTRALAAQAPWWEPGTQHGYHVFTFGWLVGEVVRRITGKSIGHYWRQEVAGPLGIDCHIGLPAELDTRVAEFIPVPPPPPGEPDIEEELIKNAGPMVQKAVNNPPKTVADMNTRAWRRAEIPAGNAHTNARALARVYGALACAGEADGVRVLSPDSVERARTEQANGADAVLFGLPTRFGLGFSLPPPGTGFGSSTAAAFGCPGAGGSIGFADPGAHIGFGYTMNHMQAGMPVDPRALRLIDAPYASL
jgi:CubicO group peptidase (beta-lactamase class C family)